jgi:hypothetical protein
MCTPTNELKLCTCKFGKSLPDNYWILHRFTTKDEQIMGSLICDYNHNITETAAIAAFIFASINNADCFDKDLSIKNKDVLEIHIFHNKANYLYYYKYVKGRWTEAENFNAFDIENDYYAVSKGITKPEISTVLKRVLK